MTDYSGLYDLARFRTCCIGDEVELLRVGLQAHRLCEIPLFRVLQSGEEGRSQSEYHREQEGGPGSDVARGV